MIEELPSQRLACRFTHEIVRRALYDRLSRLRRAELHLRVGEALESAGPASDRALADLAHHFGAAAPFGGAERAIDYNLRAARAASAALAFDEAADAAAHRARDRHRGRAPSAPRPCSSSARRATGPGKATDALEAFASAAEIARELESAELLARAAIGYEEACWRPGTGEPGRGRAARGGAGGGGRRRAAELRIGLLAGLARALDFQGERERGAIVRENAVALARRHEDRAGLAKVLVRSYWARGTTPLEEILPMLTEARDLAEELGDAEIHTEAMAWRVPTFVALGDLESARHGGRRPARDGRADRAAVHAPRGRALRVGDSPSATETSGKPRRWRSRSREWGRLLTGRDASGIYGIQMFGVRREQGRLAELAPAVRILAGGVEREGPWRPGLVAVLAELGMEARGEARAGRSSPRRASTAFAASLWLATLAYLSRRLRRARRRGDGGDRLPRARAAYGGAT